MGGSRKGFTPAQIIGEPGEAGITLVSGNKAVEINRRKGFSGAKWARLSSWLLHTYET
jgi:hypothetical protein